MPVAAKKRNKLAGQSSFADVAHQSVAKSKYTNSVPLFQYSHDTAHEDDLEAKKEDVEHLGHYGRDKSVQGMEKELRSSVAKLYQSYDFVTDEYDRLFEIIDHLREEYNNSKSSFFYHRYKEFRRMIKNALRQWRTVEKRSTLAMSRKTSNTNYSMALNTTLSRAGAQPIPKTAPVIIVDDGSTMYSQNLDARLRAQHSSATRDLYAECTRLEREIVQYKSRNLQIKNLLSKLNESYDNSKAHVLHVWGRYKELKAMIKEVIDSDI